jgi:hypothetical protein
MQKRTTVPFYNRRRSLEQRETPMAANETTKPTQSTLSSFFNLFSKRAHNTTTSCVPTAVTKTVTVKAACSSTSTSQSAPNTTYIGPPLPCLPTSVATSTVDPTSPKPDCTCDDDQDPDTIFQRPNGQVYVSPAPVQAPAPSPTQDTLPVFQRLNGQPFDMPESAPSSIVKRQATDWRRVAYYTSTAPAQATGFSFMANLGDPQKSGTFD